MGYVAPDSDVRLLRGVPIDRDYNHTKYHEIDANMAVNLENQYNSFNNFYHIDFDKQSYQRSGKNKIRIGVSIDRVYDMNYMIFKNKRHEKKYYYAFIDSISYVNENACEISYTLDVMQTWYFDYDLADCYVEREHALTDEIGDNVVDEKIDAGELIVIDKDSYLYTRSSALLPLFKLVILYVPNNEKSYIQSYFYDSQDDIFHFYLTSCEVNGRYDTGTVINGIYSGCKYITVDINVDSTTYINRTRMIIDQIVNKILGTDIGGRIVGMVQVPRQLWDAWATSPAGVGSATKTIDMTNYFRKVGVTGQPGSGEFYVPKNNKLYTYPYRSIVVSNNAGQTATYKWEYCSETPQTGFKKSATFNIDGTPITMPEIMCYPTNYRGIDKDYESGIVLNDFPIPSWSEDSFAQWWAQNKSAYISSIIASSVALVGSAVATAVTYGAAAPSTVAAATATASAIGIGTSAAGNIASKLGQYMTATNTPDQIGGQATISSLRTLQNRIGFYFYDMGISAERARIVDNYFTMYGYAIRQVKKPYVRWTKNEWNSTSTNPENLHLRQYYNYIKTGNCLVHATPGLGLPAEDEEKIVKIYNNGITFWSNFNYFGDYSIPNEIQ